MLRTRIITALILAPLALAAVIYLPTPWVAVVFGLITALGAYEWAGLAGLNGAVARLAYTLVYVLLILGLFVRESRFEFALPFSVRGVVRATLGVSQRLDAKE